MATTEQNPFKRPLNLEALNLEKGSHEEAQKAFCTMEAVGYIAGEPWGYRPKCASPVITDLMVRLNDRLPDADRQRLKPLIPLIVGTRTNDADEATRRQMIHDWVCREALPHWLELAKMPEQAERVRKLAGGTREELRAALYEIRDIAWSTRQKRFDALRAALREKLEPILKEKAVAAAAAVAAAVAAAAAVADAVADADAAAAAAAAAAADAAAAAVAVKNLQWPNPGYYAVRDAVYKVARAKADELIAGKFGPLKEQLLTGALELVHRLVEVGKKPEAPAQPAPTAKKTTKRKGRAA